MVTATTIIFSKRAAQRILGTAIKLVKVVNRAVLVVYWQEDKWVSQFFSRQLFLNHFAEWRRQKGRAVTIRRGNVQDGIWVAEGKQDYLVIVKDDLMMCECEDFANQEQFGFKVSCCKHIYAVLGQLGYSSVRGYLGARELVAA